MPLEIAAASHSAPWWVLGAVGVFMIPLVFTAVWKWFLKGKAEMSVMELSQAQGGIYRTAITDSAEIIRSLQVARDQAEQKYTELLKKLADVTDQYTSSRLTENSSANVSSANALSHSFGMTPRASLSS